MANINIYLLVALGISEALALIPGSAQYKGILASVVAVLKKLTA